MNIRKAHPTDFLFLIFGITYILDTDFTQLSGIRVAGIIILTTWFILFVMRLASKK